MRRIGTFLALPVAAGAVAGVLASAFPWLIAQLGELLSAVTRWAPGAWGVILSAVLAGLVYGPLLQRFAPGVRGQGITQVMRAVDDSDGRMPLGTTAVMVSASAVCIAGGGSVGRIGPVVHLAGAFGSLLGRLAALPGPRLSTLVAASAAAGFAAILDVPVSAPFFAIELILRRFSLGCFTSAAIAAAVADLVADHLAPNIPLVPAPPSRPETAGVLAPALIGLAVGAAGCLFVHVFFRVRRLCEWVWRGPSWLRPACGGLLLGGLVAALPQLHGVGASAVHEALRGQYPLVLLALLLAGKIVATSLTLGAGGCGGLFGPILFIGAIGGTLLATALARPEDVWLYGLLGMAAAMAAAARIPVTAIVVVLELTAMPALVVPLAVTVLAATLTARLLTRTGIFTHDLPHPAPEGPKPGGAPHPHPPVR